MQIATYFFSIVALLMDNYFIINMLDLLNDVKCNSKVNKLFIILLKIDLLMHCFLVTVSYYSNF